MWFVVNALLPEWVRILFLILNIMMSFLIFTLKIYLLGTKFLLSWEEPIITLNLCSGKFFSVLRYVYFTCNSLRKWVLLSWQLILVGERLTLASFLYSATVIFLLYILKQMLPPYVKCVPPGRPQGRGCLWEKCSSVD